MWDRNFLRNKLEEGSRLSVVIFGLPENIGTISAVVILGRVLVGIVFGVLVVCAIGASGDEGGVCVSCSGVSKMRLDTDDSADESSVVSGSLTVISGVRDSKRPLLFLG
jgi:hypothetical protein